MFVNSIIRHAFINAQVKPTASPVVIKLCIAALEKNNGVVRLRDKFRV